MIEGERGLEKTMPVLTINGFKHNYEVVGEGEPLVYLAGTRFDNAKTWARYFERNAVGYRTVLPDPRGMAESAHVARVEPQDWGDDLLVLLDALGIEKVHLAGETFGTRIVTRFAADHPERVRTLIVNAVIAYSAPSADDYRAEMTAERRARLQQFQGDGWETVNRFYLEMHARADFHEYFDMRQVAPRVSVPALILRGDIDDPVHGVAHSVELHRLIPMSWLAIYPNTEFNALRGRPAETWKTIREFTAAFS